MASRASPGAIAREADAVIVEAPGRLHLGFLDPSGSLGRRFGSLGVMLDGLSTRVEIARADRDELTALDASETRELERLAAYLEAMRRATGEGAPVRITLHRALPAHSGFGSGTQLALSLGHAFTTLHDLPFTTREIAHLLARGARSGVGIAGFDHGGFIVDGGPAPDGTAAPLLSRLAFPDAWRIVLAIDPTFTGLHGAGERAAMATLAPFAAASAADLCHHVVMGVLPALAEEDFGTFAHGIDHVQQANGRYFAPAQGGAIFVSPAVARVMDTIRARREAAVGQTSWGPTGFAFVASQADAEEAIADARAPADAAGLRLMIVGGRNRGATTSRSRERSSALDGASEPGAPS